MAQPQEGKRGWGDRVRHRLAKMGIGDEAHAAAVEYEPPPTVTQLGPADAALSGGRLGPVAEESGGSFTQGHPPDAGHLGPEAGGSIDSTAQQGGGQAVRRKITGGLQAVGRSLSKVRSRGLEARGGDRILACSILQVELVPCLRTVLPLALQTIQPTQQFITTPTHLPPQVKTKLTPGERQLAAAEELAEHDVDVAIRVGLAAFAVSGGVRLVCAVRCGWAPGKPSLPECSRVQESLSRASADSSHCLALLQPFPLQPTSRACCAPRCNRAWVATPQGPARPCCAGVCCSTCSGECTAPRCGFVRSNAVPAGSS